MDYVWFMKFWMDYVWMFKSLSFLEIKKSYYLYKKINKFKNPWVPMNTHGYINTRGYSHNGYPRGYGADTGIIFIQRGRVSYYPYPWVPIDIPKGNLDFWVSHWEPIQFFPKNPDFDSIWTKFVFQTLLLVNIHQKEIKTLTNMNS